MVAFVCGFVLYTYHMVQIGLKATESFIGGCWGRYMLIARIYDLYDYRIHITQDAATRTIGFAGAISWAGAMRMLSEGVLC